MVPNKLQPHREKTHLYGANPQTHRTGETNGILAADLPEQGLHFHPHLSVLLQNISATQQVRDKLLTTCLSPAQWSLGHLLTRSL